jgi:hypothetical protein
MRGAAELHEAGPWQRKGRGRCEPPSVLEGSLFEHRYVPTWRRSLANPPVSHNQRPWYTLASDDLKTHLEALVVGILEPGCSSYLYIAPDKPMQLRVFRCKSAWYMYVYFLCLGLNRRKGEEFKKGEEGRMDQSRKNFQKCAIQGIFSFSCADSDFYACYRCHIGSSCAQGTHQLCAEDNSWVITLSFVLGGEDHT